MAGSRDIRSDFTLELGTQTRTDDDFPKSRRSWRRYGLRQSQIMLLTNRLFLLLYPVRTEDSRQALTQQ